MLYLLRFTYLRTTTKIWRIWETEAAAFAAVSQPPNEPPTRETAGGFVPLRKKGKNKRAVCGAAAHQ